MNEELLTALADVCEEKGIEKDVVLDALEMALVAAYKKNYSSPQNGDDYKKVGNFSNDDFKKNGAPQNVEVQLDRVTGEIHVYMQKTVVAEEDFLEPQKEMPIEEAKKISGVYEVGDVVNIEVTPRNFGRIAAMTAKQVVTQRIREAERGIIYGELTEKENDIISGRVSRIEKGNVFVDIGKLEAMLPVKEQPQGEQYEIGQMLKCYVSDVKNSAKGTQIMLSRTHPGLVKKLFALEVPEIADGIVEIKGVSREAGSRTKISVWAADESIDPQGACIGPKGVRVQAIGDELKNEKIDIIKWSENAAEFIAASLSPSKVLSVELNEEEKSAKVTVPEYQLSLAIGKSGQNVRLAARLTGWKIDISASAE